MGPLSNARIGDRFRWKGTENVCQIVAINGDVYFYKVIGGPHKGHRSWTLGPGDVEIVTVLDELAMIDDGSE